MSSNCNDCSPDVSVLFGVGRTKARSHKFQVTDKVVRLTAFNISEGVEVCVQRCVTVCGEDFFTPAIEGPCCCPVKLNDRCSTADLTTPGWYYADLTGAAPEDVTVLQDELQIETVINIGGSGMSCGLTIAEVKEIVNGCIAAIAPDKFVDRVQTSNAGFTIVMNDGSTHQLPLTSPDGTVSITGGALIVEVEALATKICADAEAVNRLVECLPSLCEMVAALPVSATPIGG